jgi:hypothetical protein
MAGPEQERERELAALLKEVRALRESLDELKAGLPRLPPDYAVLARTRPELPPDYAVAVRTGAALPPDYAVLVRQAALPPEYQVLVRAVRPEAGEGPIADG